MNVAPKLSGSCGAEGFGDIQAAVKRRFGDVARIDNIVVPTLGGSNRTVLFDLVQGSSRRRLASRQETFIEEGNVFLPPSAQFRIMQVVHSHGFPVPEPIFQYDAVDGLGNGFVTEFIGGESMPRRLLDDTLYEGIRQRLAGELGRLLALLHTVDIKPLHFLSDLPSSLDPVDSCRQMLDATGERHPAFEIGLRWLERNRPKDRGKQFLVHGDYRIGNFLVSPQGVNAVLDWENSHLGSPAEDLGWLCTRSWRFGNFDKPVGGFGHRHQLLEGYTSASGQRIEVDEIRYWEILGLVRWGIFNVLQAYGHIHGGRRSVVFAACGRNAALIEYELLMSIRGDYN